MFKALEWIQIDIKLMHCDTAQHAYFIHISIPGLRLFYRRIAFKAIAEIVYCLDVKLHIAWVVNMS